MKIFALFLPILLLITGIYIGNRYISSTSDQGKMNTKVSASDAIKPTSSLRDWKVFKTSYPPNWARYNNQVKNIEIKYPSDLSYKEEYAHATVDLGVFFSNPQGKIVVSFTYSDMDFKEGFYNSQAFHLGDLKSVTLRNRAGYKFENQFGYIEGYYFPLSKGYYSLQLFDSNYRNIMEDMLSTVKISQL
jgi:hypothetical protein